MSIRFWFVYDTIFAWGIVAMCSVILVARPTPQSWRNIALGIIAATEALVWFRMLKHRRRDPELAHRQFFLPAMVPFLAYILVSSRTLW